MKLKKLRKRCKALAYHVRVLELEKQARELQGQAAQSKPFGFHQSKTKKDSEQ